MRKIIRKWLGIENVEAKTPAMPTQADLRLLIGEAFECALNGKEDYPWCEIWGCHHIPNRLERALENASLKTASEVAAAHIEHRIGGEAFIDEVVARIQRKQLP